MADPVRRATILRLLTERLAGRGHFNNLRPKQGGQDQDAQEAVHGFRIQAGDCGRQGAVLAVMEVLSATCCRAHTTSCGA